MKYSGPYIPPTLTIDAVIFEVINGVLNVLLHRRPNEPFKDMWALPGGYNAANETTTQALQRIIKYKTGVDVTDDLAYIEQLYTFDTIDRDPRGHAVSVTYMGCGRDITADKLTANTQFFAVNELPALAYDHESIVRYAHERLTSKLVYTNAVYAFLPPTFTLTHLQSAYEAIFGRQFDKRNFRKKFLSLGLIRETNKTWREGAHRPAKLYRFNKTELETLSRDFE